MHQDQLERDSFDRTYGILDKSSRNARQPFTTGDNKSIMLHLFGNGPATTLALPARPDRGATTGALAHKSNALPADVLPTEISDYRRMKFCNSSKVRLEGAGLVGR